MECFDLILTQNDEMKEAMIDMHAPSDRVESGINLKALSQPLAQNPSVLAPLRTSLKGRPMWVAASTHRGEEEIVLKAHKQLLQSHPGLLLLLAPRHPDRKADIKRLIAQEGMDTATRSDGEMPDHHAVYLADTMGEMGNWYALSHIVFLGGSLKPVGGHNPFEVAQAGSGVISGPEVFNFSETYAEMVECKAAKIVTDEAELAEAVSLLLSDRQALDDAGRHAREFVRGKASHLNRIASRLCTALALEGVAS
jgi:3-deoxy-D-manno-octulosonic-acid transferase